MYADQRSEGKMDFQLKPFLLICVLALIIMLAFSSFHAFAGGSVQRVSFNFGVS